VHRDHLATGSSPNAAAELLDPSDPSDLMGTSTRWDEIDRVGTKMVS